VIGVSISAGSCPKCAAVIPLSYTSNKCGNCGEPLPRTITELLPVSASVSSSGGHAASTPSTQVFTRFAAAYRTANDVISLGTIIQNLGITIGAALGLLAFLLGNGAVLEQSQTFLCFAFAVLVALSSWISGTLVKAQGHILRACVDTAVNSSPFLDNAQQTEVMGVTSSRA
jgi:hypothetical protein